MEGAPKTGELVAAGAGEKVGLFVIEKEEVVATAGAKEKEYWG